MALYTRFNIWFIRTLYCKIRQILLQNVTAILLQNSTEVYYKMFQVFYYDNYYKMQQFYYKMQRFYYKMRHLLQIATIHSVTRFNEFLLLITYIKHIYMAMLNHVEPFDSSS